MLSCYTTSLFMSSPVRNVYTCKQYANCVQKKIWWMVVDLVSFSWHWFICSVIFSPVIASESNCIGFFFFFFRITNPPHLFICQFIKSVKASPCQRHGHIRLHIQQLMTDSWHVSVTLFIHTFSTTLSQRCDSNLITAHTSLLLTDVWTECKLICMKCFFFDDTMNGALMKVKSNSPQIHTCIFNANSLCHKDACI